MMTMASRARPNKASIALLLLLAIILAALVNGADAAKRPPTPKKNKNKNKKSSSSSSLAFAAAPAACNPPCANGAGCVKGQCKCHPGSSGPACATLLPGYFFDTKVSKPMQCPVNFYCRGGGTAAADDTLPIACPIDHRTQGAGKSAVTDCTPVRCGNPTQCRSLVCSLENHRCLPATCQDNVKNGAETDADCGGPTCGACADGKGCLVAGDCSSGVCSSDNKICLAPTCADGVKNGAETDVDCGGSCSACADGKACSGAGDCTSGVCSGSVCQVPTCSDGVKNGVETDVDCGGGTCTKCADDKKCTGNDDCLSARCVGGTCQVAVSGALSFSGVRNELADADVLQGGFSLCYRDTYNQVPDTTKLVTDCNQGVLLLACRPTGSTTSTVAAMGLRSEVLTVVPNNYDAAHTHNDVQWYYSTDYSMGFAPAGVGLSRSSCDTGSDMDGQRLCWHTDPWSGGWRCGSTKWLNNGAAESPGWERVVFHRAGGL